MSTRTTVLWVPDWPVVAAATVRRRCRRTCPPRCTTGGSSPRSPRSPAPRACAGGCAVGRRRACCPELVLLPADDARDVRLFEPVAAAAETVVAGIEVVRAGLLLLPAGGASRYHGSEEALAERLIDAVAARRRGTSARSARPTGCSRRCWPPGPARWCPRGRRRAFLAPRGDGELVHAAVTDEAAAAVAELVDLLHRLGLRHARRRSPRCRRTDVHARFGRLGAWAQHARPRATTSARPPAAGRRRTSRWPPTSTRPLDRVDAATFAGRRLAEELHALLVAALRRRAGGCRSPRAPTTGTDLVRTWRTDLGGWGGLTAGPHHRPDPLAAGGLAGRERGRDRPEPRGGRPAARARPGGPGRGRVGRDPWAHDDLPTTRGPTRTRARSRWCTSRSPPWTSPRRVPSRGGCGAGRPAVTCARTGRWTGCRGSSAGRGSSSRRLQGGRDVRDQVHLRPWGEQTEPARPVDRPWPGRLPDPAPATVLDPPEPVDVRDAAGVPVVLDVRSGMRGEPAWCGGCRA